MKINPVFAIVFGVILLAVGLVTHLITLDIAGAFVAVVAAARMVRNGRGGAGRGGAGRGVRS